MKTSPHRIRRRTLELHVRRPDEGAAWRTQARGLWDEALQPALERVFDEFSPGDVIARIHRLEITLRLNPDRPRTRVSDEFADALRAGLVNARRQPGAREGEVQASGLEDLAPTARARQWLSHWLTQGTAPWWAGEVDADSTAHAFLTALRDASGGDGWLREILLAHPAAARRLADHLPTGRQAEVLRAAGAGPVADESATLFQELAGKSAGQARAVVAVLWECAWRSWARAEALTPAWLHGVANVAGELAAATPDILRHALAAQRGRSDAPSTSAQIKRPPAVPATPSVDEPPEALEPEEELGGETGELFPIHNAGLILLAPFLPNFFEALGCGHLLRPRKDEAWEEGGDGDDAARLTLLVHHLATGACTAFEPDLLLPKLLCGLPARWPAPGRIDPSALEQSESASLLAAVISHWSALGETSIDGLRSSFLMRPGVLERLDEGWRLQVESRGWDVLLERVPWTFQMIKLPWMAQPIWTEWNPPT